MKTLLINSVVSIMLCCIGPVSLVAQNVSITNAGPSADGSTILDTKSIDKGILLPRMTASQRSSIPGPAKGLLVFQTDGTAGFYYYDGQLWISLINGDRVTNTGFSEAYGLVTVFAGSTHGYANGFGTTARFKHPLGITIDQTGNLYVADSGNYSIRKVTPLGVATSFAGSIVGGLSDGTGSNASFNFPADIAIDQAGNLYVADESNSLIRKITPAGMVTRLAGSAQGFADGIGTNANFNYPSGIAADAAGNLYVSDTYNHRIRKITPAAEVTTLAGNGSPGSSDGTGAAAAFARPSGLTLDAAGNIYVADIDNHSIRKITAAGVVTTFTGTGLPGAADGTLSSASFHSPRDITMDMDGNFYIADAGNHVIRKITPDGIVSTLAGSGLPGNTAGQSATAYFNDPSGLVADTMGNLYVTDGANHVIRKIIIR